MILLKIQLESQSRPIYASAQDPLGKGVNVVISSESIEQLGEVIDRCDCLEPCFKNHKAHFVRLATPEDLARREEHKKLEGDALRFCKKTSKELGLSMRLVKVHHYFDSSKIIFYYTAESRVDFRELVKILARNYKTRIEMRQIGVRDETKLCGGVGHCGLRLCCSVHLTSFAPVTVKMAKDQGLSLNPAKISGMCGRLMCCLRYEIEPDRVPDDPVETPERAPKGSEE
jgi:cell fate regulator YaaT (PSP1 superfamily)